MPVGTEALREARTLQEKHKARKAVVISNAPFTTSVEREAERADALLVHHFSLSLLAPMVEL
ncbi:MAG: restriction endonuclease [Steroidobacter sp.]